MKRGWFAGMVALVMSMSAASAQRPQPPARPIGNEAFDLYQHFFDYDNSLPLNARTIERTDSASFHLEKFVFDGWHSRVPGLIAFPRSAAARSPVILLITGIGGWKESWLQRDGWNRGRALVDSLIAAKYAVVMIDAPLSGDRKADNDFSSSEPLVNKPAQLRDLTLQLTIEHRRLLDYLATRTDVDTTKIGAVGLSLGAMVTFYLGALDPRLKVGVAGLTPAQISPPLWPGHFAPHVRIPVLMLMGRTDGYYTHAQADQIFGLIPTTKDSVWYDVGHRLPPEYAGPVVNWLRRFLK
jgi:dienelactone hydrolase